MQTPSISFKLTNFSIYNGEISSSFYRSNVEVTSNWNLCSDSNLSPHLQAPEPGELQLQVTHYNFSYTTDNEDSCYEILPSCTTSYNLTVVAGVQYTITVSALSNGRESQDNPQLDFSMLAYVHIDILLRFTQQNMHMQILSSILLNKGFETGRD